MQSYSDVPRIYIPGKLIASVLIFIGMIISALIIVAYIAPILNRAVEELDRVAGVLTNIPGLDSQGGMQSVDSRMVYEPLVQQQR